MDHEHSERLLRTTSGAAKADLEAPQSILHAAFDAVIRGDFNAFGNAVTDDVELSIRGVDRLDGRWRGRAEVVAATRENFAMLAEQKPEIEDMIASENCIAVLLRERGVFKSDGRPYSVRGVQWFTFAGGKIRKIDEILAETPDS
ncbi:MAG TPA: nuclear transport factor 2 family protein [Bryobacteraceae bacterium]|nr:nuclear transport factor 2 family protein [Bryobacteraceae bacterium]